MQDVDIINSWKDKAKNFEEKFNVSADTMLAVKFKEKKNKEAVNILKDLKFKWNKFRKEYYGNANKKQIEHQLSKFDVNVEVL